MAAGAASLPEVADTVVVGAGIAGLSYAHALGPDVDVLVLEATDRPGGLVRTERLAVDEGPLHVERGPEAVQDDAPETLALLDELDLEPSPAPALAANRWVLDEHGRLLPVPMGPGSFLRSPLLPWRSKLRALSEPWRRPGVALDGSIADFVRHRLGRTVLARLVDPAVSGIYASDPELVSLRAAFPALAGLVAEHGSILRGLKARRRARRASDGEAPAGRAGPPSLFSVEGGLETIPRAIADRLGERLVLGAAASRVGLGPDGWEVDVGGTLPRREDGDWVLPEDGGEAAVEPATVRARAVVLAAPAPVAAALLVQDHRALAEEAGSMVAESVVSVAHVWSRDDVGHPLDGFGYLVPSFLDRLHLGTLFSSSIQPARCPEGLVVLRTLYGGARHPEMPWVDDPRLLGILRREVAPLLEIRPEAEPRRMHVSRWPLALPRYDLDQPARQDRIDALLAELPGLHLLGNYRRGIALNALIASSRRLGRRHRAGDLADGAPS